MHLFELATANRALLTYMLDATKLTNRVQLHPFAASNVTQEMTVFKGLYAGDERGSALVGKKAYRLQKGNATETVRAVALDDFFQEKRLRDLTPATYIGEAAKLARAI